jgi:hypothetical protein
MSAISTRPLEGEVITLPEGVTLADLDKFEESINHIIKVSHLLAQKWWTDPKTGENLRNNPLIVPTKLLLMVGEICEGMEGDRTDAMDDHLPQFPSIWTEMADLFIRAGDLAGAKEWDVGAAAKAKLLYNATRSDHKVENRVKKGGKKY